MYHLDLDKFICLFRHPTPLVLSHYCSPADFLGLLHMCIASALVYHVVLVWGPQWSVVYLCVLYYFLVYLRFILYFLTCSISSGFVTLWICRMKVKYIYKYKFGACASSLVFPQCTVKNVAVSDIGLPLYSDWIPCEGEIAELQWLLFVCSGATSIRRRVTLNMLYKLWCALSEKVILKHTSFCTTST
jgi:hypothetical protein